MSWAFRYLKVIAEPSSAVALAAVTGLGPSTEPAGIILSGGSVGLDAFVQLVTTAPGRRPPVD